MHYIRISYYMINIIFSRSSFISLSSSAVYMYILNAVDWVNIYTVHIMSHSYMHYHMHSIH